MLPDTILHVTEVYLLIGSNIEPEKNLVLAVGLLRQLGLVLALSSVYQTTPQGYSEQADFLNMAVALKTSYTIEDFRRLAVEGIERDLGRVRDPNNVNAPRTIDLDIALWGHRVMDYGEKPWHVPNQDILRFAHVAIPLAEIAPDYVHPEVGQTLACIATGFETKFPIRKDIQFV
jgi:2-amino-4-hydroxy-6-hydroxymethyldihydropteridine diphosphokinase